MSNARASRYISAAIARLLPAALLPIVVAGAFQPARADTPVPVENAGSLAARRADGTVLGACPLRHTRVAIDVAGFVATVTVTQRFENPFLEPVEAVYTFPLSEHAAVDTMQMRVGERVIRGEIRRREDARRIFEAARARGQVASLLDQERPNVFTQSIANLMPGVPVEVTLSYVEPLPYRDGVFSLAFPTVVGPRFVPGTATGAASGTGWARDTDRVPDASRITPPATPPGTRAGHDIDISAEIAAGMPIGDVSAPLHEVAIDRPASDRVRVRLVNRAEIPNRDFVLRWAVAGDDVRSTVLAHRVAGADGYVTLVLIPPKHVSAEHAAPKEIVFIVDRSGSQAGLPLEKAKETMRWMLDHLNSRDTFQIVDFGNEANVLFDRPQLATSDAKHRARVHIDALAANGGTMMAEAIRAACATPADEHRLRVVTFMTDGYVGNDFEVLDLVRQLRATSRWFPFGTGNSVNRFLIDGMARLGGGEPEYVLLDDAGDKVAERFYRRLAAPVLTDVRLRFEGVEVQNLVPAALGDVWAERPLVVHGRYATAGHGRVVIEGFERGAPYRATLDVVLPEAATHPALAPMWARARVEALLDEDLQGLQSGSLSAVVKEQVVALALEHHLVTQFTSFVAVEERIVNEGGHQRRVTVPVEMPDGVSYTGVFGEPMPAEASLSAHPAAGALEKLARGPAMVGPGLQDLSGALRDSDAPDARKRSRAAAPTSSSDGAGTSDRLTTIARAKVSAPLLAMLSNAVEPPDGAVLVRVVLRGQPRNAARKLTAAGLRIERLADGVAIGTIGLDRIGRLAALPIVARVMLATESDARG